MSNSRNNHQWRIQSILGGSVGNLVEWYDWYAYAAFSIYFAKHFFPNSNPTAQLLNTAGIFAVGFLMRPLGGWLFGNILIGGLIGIAIDFLTGSAYKLTPTTVDVDFYKEYDNKVNQTIR